MDAFSVPKHFMSALAATIEKFFQSLNFANYRRLKKLFEPSEKIITFMDTRDC